MNVIFFRTYKWEIWLSNILPYWLPFISKKKEEAEYADYLRLKEKYEN